MAIDKAVDSTQLNADLTSVANAIRTKGGTSAQLVFPADFVSAINEIPSGGGSNYTLLASEELTVSTTSTTAAAIQWIEFPVSSLDDYWNKNIFLYIRVRDKAGKRNGYFYGTDYFAVNYLAANEVTGQYLQTFLNICYRVKTDGTYGVSTSSYGIYPYNIERSTTGYGRIQMYRRYNASSSLTINGTYVVDVYRLTPPTGKTILE